MKEFSKSGPLQVRALGEYTVHLFTQCTSQKPTDRPRYSRFDADLSVLHEEHADFHLAIERFSMARQLMEDQAQKRQMNDKHLALRVRAKSSTSENHSIFVTQLAPLLANVHFARLVVPSLYEQAIASLPASRLIALT